MTLWSVTASLIFLVALVEDVFCLVVNEGKSRAPSSSRRHFFQYGSSLLVGSTAPLVSHAQQEYPRDSGFKPFAPLQALLPATRLKVWVDRAHALSSSLASTSDKQTQYDILKELNDLLSKTPKLFDSETVIKERTLPSTAQLTTGVSSANKQDYRRNRSDLSVPDRLAAMLNQADVERQWGMLQYQELKLQKENEMRAAFNYYTTNLLFSDYYVLTASDQYKKRMIRNEKLPTVADVIISDLDVRELYRNTFLTTIEDAKAEVAYQVKQPVDTIDTKDTIDLVNQSYSACMEWFALISPQDVQEALDVVTKESK